MISSSCSFDAIPTANQTTLYIKQAMAAFFQGKPNTDQATQE
jgi:hypothetical protein